MKRRTCMITLVACLGTFFLSSQAGAQGAANGPIFPQPFMVEHQAVQTLPDGDSFVSDPVSDYYGGSWIVSVRADGSRMVVDLARRELTEIRPEKGSFSVLSFDRFAELRRRYVAADRGVQYVEQSAKSEGAETRFRFNVAELPPTGMQASKGGRPEANEALLRREGVRLLQVKAVRTDNGKTAGAMDFWLDPELRLTPRAEAALDAFEQTVLTAGGGDNAPSFAQFNSEARRTAKGAFVFQSSRPLTLEVPAEEAGSLEDVALELKYLDVFPEELLEIPEGLERTPHALELIVAHAESEAELRARMGVSAAQ